MPFKQKELKSFLLKNKVDVIGILETRIEVNKAEKISRNFWSN